MDSFDKKATEKFDKSTIRAAEKLIGKSKELKKIRSIKDGMAYSEINSGVNDQQYKDNYDKIDWGKSKVKPKFRTKINGVYQDDND